MQLFPVDAPWPGRLALGARPRSGPWLEDDIGSLPASGFDLLVSALTPEEMTKSELDGVPAICLAHGIEFVHFPVGNLMVPEVEAALPLLQGWHQALMEGRGVAIHCWGGVGRSATLAAALLTLGGVDAEDAWSRVETARGREVPDTPEQHQWVFDVARRRVADGLDERGEDGA